MARQITQCLSCSRVKQPDNSWLYEEIGPFQRDISHTYCSDCIRTLQEKLLAARDFKKWSLDRQLAYLDNELDKQPKKFDEISFKNYMEEFFCVSEKEYYQKYFSPLKHKLVSAICPKCKTEVTIDDYTTPLGIHRLHNHCFKELSHKLKILVDNGWQKSGKLDAYFDLLRIEKDVRPVIKQMLNRGMDSKITGELV